MKKYFYMIFVFTLLILPEYKSSAQILFKDAVKKSNISTEEAMEYYLREMLKIHLTLIYEVNILMQELK